MTIHSELESIYLLGEFGLKSLQAGWELVPDRKLTAGSWAAQGLPFYSDGVSYSRTYRMSPAEGRYVVRLDTWNGCVASVIVNGKEAGIIGWQPWEADITGLVKDGENTVEVVVYGTLKNLLGPHHNNPPRGRAWPAMFQNGPDTQPPGSDYDVIGYGLFEDFTVVHQH